MKRFVVLALLAVFVLVSCSLTGDRYIASVGGHKISTEELYRYLPEANFNALSPEEKQAKIDLICDEYLARYYLEEQHELDSGNVFWEIRVWETKELANGAFQHLIVDKILTKEAMQNLYNKMKYELDVSHLLIGYNTGTRKLNDRTREEAETLVGDIYEKISGDNFTDMVMEYSDDGSKQENSGNLGWAKAGRWVEAFEDAAYNLKPGEISKPIETPFGFHIIKLNERREIPVPPYEEAEADLIELAFNRWRTKILERQSAVFDSLTVANPLMYDDSLLTDFIDRFTRLSKNVFYSEQFTSFDILEIFDDTLTVGYLGDSPIDKNWIYRYLKMESLQVPPRFTDVEAFKSFVNQNRIGALLNKAAINLKLDRSSEYEKTRNVYLAQKSAPLFDKLYVYEQINPNPAEIRSFYEENKSDLYKLDARVRVKEVLLSDSLTARDILSRAKNGEDMGDLATEYSIRNYGKKNRGLIPPIKKDQYGEMSLAAFNMKDGEMAGPFKIGEHYSIIERVEYIPEQYKDYNDVSYRLLTDYRTHHMEKKRAEQREMLRHKYSVRINKSFIK